MRSAWKGTLALPALMTLACGAPPAPPANPPATAAKAPAITPAATTVAAGDFGVPECDDYMTKYLACIDTKVPADMRGMLRTSFDQQKAAWKQAAATPQGRDGLKTGCTQALAMAKQSMTPYGCTF